MKGDFSRDTFHRQHHFARVLMQQGRVLLDADWNEQTSILLHYLRTLAVDLIGPHGGPGDGFKITCDAELKCDFVIGSGHYYVDGILCENHPPLRCPPDEEITPVTYNNQSLYPLVEEDDVKLKNNGSYLVYLDVWERHLSHLQVDHIREVALGGPDTATRAQIVCQVKVAEEPKDTSDDATCVDLMGALVEERRRCLRARARVETPSDDPCIIPPEARYRGAENQLYRVEIHDGGAGGAAKDGATFKWSRDNGSVVFAIRSLQGSTATLDSLGPDDRRSLKESDWVEIVDDFSTLRFAPHRLLQVDAVDRVGFSVTLAVPDGTQLPVFNADSTTHPILRRWDQSSDVLAVQEGKWIDLEDGVQIYFEPAGQYQTGDYWLIPARTATGNVLWPTDAENAPEALPPHGIEHHYAPLARVSLDDNGNVTCGDDCRCSFDPLCAAAVAPSQAPAIDEITATPSGTDTCQDSQVRFSANVRGIEPLNYVWDFGDGNKSEDRQPTHHFSRAVSHTVRLAVANDVGEATATLQISVAPCERAELADITFPANEAALSDQHAEMMASNQKLLSELFAANATSHATVIGFAAPGETRPIELATARANVVHKLYLEQGLPANRLSMKGGGIDSDPHRPDAQKRRAVTTLAGFSGSGIKSRDEKLAALRLIDSIGDKRAEVLVDAGRDTPLAVASMTDSELMTLLGISESIAQTIKTSAREMAKDSI